MADRFDLDAIEADDALLDLLAAGGESAWQAGEYDPALKLLADLRLAVEVEGELPVETIDDPESFLARCAALNPVTDPFARKLAARGLALGVAAVAALSVSGVAAAVTGNPLSPYEKVIEKIADGLRPETSLPKEQLDGLPAFDKTKIVKVGKDFRKNQEQRNEDEQTAAVPPVGSADEPAQSVVGPKPPFLVPPTVDKTSPIETTPVVPPPVDPKPADPEPTDANPPAPVDPKPTDAPTQAPTDGPTEQPTEQPSTPETPPPTETTPSTPPSTPPTDNGSTGNPGENPPENPGSTPSAPVTSEPPITLPSTGTGETSTGTDSDDSGTPSGSDNSGDTQTTPGGQTGDQSGDSKPEVPAPDVPTVEVPVVELPSGRVGDESGGKGGDPVSEVVEKLVPVVLPTPTGAPVEEPVRLEQYFGKGFTGHGKHSSGKPALGWAKSQYAKGKHSTGHYAEGRHAAITRAHGSMAPVTIRQILGVLNTPMSDR